MNWQPIETAPKDETLILVFCEENNKCGYAIMDCSKDDSWAAWSGCGYFYTSLQDINATHWMPLPEPPK